MTGFQRKLGPPVSGFLLTWLAGTNRSHYAARSSPILMARRKSDRFATCASNTRFHARFQIVLIFPDPASL